MALEEALTAKLLADAPLAAVVGTRVTWGRRQQGGALPAIVMHLISSIPNYADEGDVGLDNALVQIDVLAVDGATSAEMQTMTVERLVRTALASVSMVQSGVTFQGVFPEDVSSIDYTEDAQAGIPIARRILQYR